MEINRSNFNYWLSVLAFFLTIILVSCNDDSDDDDTLGNWIDRWDFEGTARSHAVSFTIGEKAYIVSGYDGDERVRLQDCWEYDPSKNKWSRKTDFPGVGRTSAIGFSINGKGYMGTGYDGSNKLKDFWEYNPELDQWIQKSDFEGTPRYGSVAFAIGNSGFIVSGFDGNYLQECWRYDPSTDSWTQKSSLYGKRFNAISFVIGNTAYVLGGNNNASYVEIFCAYDATTDTWVRKRDPANNTDDDYDDDYISIVRQNGAAFVINDLGYVATGDIGGLISKVWEYNPTKDLWFEKTAFEGSSRNNAVGITVQNRGFILTGKTSSLYLDDIWEFEPFAEYNESD